MNIRLIIIGLILLSFKGAFAQMAPLKDFTENNPKAKLSRFSKVCLYPSTLRMINIKQNEDYNELVSDIDKVLIYVLDSNFLSKTDVYSLFKTYREMGFEEFASIKSTEQSLVILGKDNDDIVGLVGGKEANKTMLFYLRGKIKWQKIPALMETLKSNDVVNVFNFRENFN